MNLRKIAEDALRETMDTDEDTSNCSLDIENCKAKNGPSKCRFHCKRYMDLLAESKTFEESVWILYNTFGVRCLVRAAVSHGVQDKNFANTILNMTTHISEADAKKTVQAYCAVLSDLRDRFENLRLPTTNLIVAESKNGGFSTVDAIAFRRTYIILNARHDFSSYNGFSFGHKDGRLKYDMIRHEVGHTIMTDNIRTSWINLLESVCKKEGINSFRRDMESISRYAADETDDQPYESFAEAFSKFTSHDYKNGDMPKWVEDFIHKIITTGRSK